MKKIHKAIVGVAIFMVVILGFGIYLINHQGSTLYFMLVSGENYKGYKEARAFANLSTDELLYIIVTNKNFNQYSTRHINWYLKFGKYRGAIKVLGSKMDERAIHKLTEIIYSANEGDKWDVIGSIRDHKNKAMAPALCVALKKHTHWHTDILIVNALVNIDDPFALECLIQEKDKITSKDARLKAEKAIEKWSKK